MHIITRRRLNEYAILHPQTGASLSAWYEVARKSRWENLQEVRQSFPHADLATVASRRSVTMFNIAGNHHRLITAIHYNTQKIFILKLLTHAQYSKNHWEKLL